jgi:hypothetical protein
MATEQSHSNHARYLPPFHFIVGPILLFYFGYSVRMLIKTPVWQNIIPAVVAFAILLFFFLTRYMVNRVQDRVIRLEERLRLAQLLPADLQGRIGEFTLDQLVALRFASDAELPTLARTVLEKGITRRSEIKKMITTWRPDYLRA